MFRRHRVAPGFGRVPARVAALCACALALCLGSACTASVPGTAVVLDEAFAMLHPELSGGLRSIAEAGAGTTTTTLRRKPIPGSGKPAPAPAKPKTASSGHPSDAAISEAEGAAGSALASRAAAGIATKSMILSPLVARGAAADTPGLPPMIVPFAVTGGGNGMPATLRLSFDLENAYRLAGMASGVQVERLRDSGRPDAAAGIMFEASGRRPESALDAFLEGFAKTSSSTPTVRRLGAGAGGTSIDPEGEARAALDEMSPTGLAVLFIAADRPRFAMETSANWRGIAVGYDLQDSPDGPFQGCGFAFTVRADGKALARVAGKAAARIASGKLVLPAEGMDLKTPASFRIERNPWPGTSGETAAPVPQAPIPAPMQVPSAGAASAP